jgi:hypothetical protein
VGVPGGLSVSILTTPTSLKSQKCSHLGIPCGLSPQGAIARDVLVALIHCSPARPLTKPSLRCVLSPHQEAMSSAAALQDVFTAFASFGASSAQREIDSSKFTKLCKVRSHTCLDQGGALHTHHAPQCTGEKQ